jgi:hypothetical protein
VGNRRDASNFKCLVADVRDLERFAAGAIGVLVGGFVPFGQSSGQETKSNEKKGQRDLVKRIHSLASTGQSSLTTGRRATSVKPFPR